jgi:hypothetical protein
MGCVGVHARQIILAHLMLLTTLSSPRPLRVGRSALAISERYPPELTAPAMGREAATCLAGARA